MAGTLSRDGLAASLVGRWRTTSLELRRGATTLSAQACRVRVGSSRSDPETSGQAGSEARGRAVVWGAVDMDVAVEDRFTQDGVLYRVTFVRPGRTVATWADCEVAQ